jgi:hypothetical protein
MNTYLLFGSDRREYRFIKLSDFEEAKKKAFDIHKWLAWQKKNPESDFEDYFNYCFGVEK